MRAALGLSAVLFFLLPLSSCKDSEDTPDDPGKKTEETDTVTQKVKVETPHVDVMAEGGEAYVFIKAYSTLNDLPKLTIDASWVKEKKHDFTGGTRATYKGYYGVVYVLDVDKNEGLGRSATLTFTYYQDAWTMWASR